MKKSVPLILVLNVLAFGCNRSPTRPEHVGRTAVPATETFAVTGVVRDSDGTPVQGADVVVQSPRLRSTAVTDDSGGYRAQASAGRIAVRATKLGFLSTTIQKDILGDAVIDLVLGIRLVLNVGETVSGIVAVDDPICDPVRWDASARCARYLFTPPRNGRVEIVLASGDGATNGALELVFLTNADEYLAFGEQTDSGQRLSMGVLAGTEYEVRVYYYPTSASPRSFTLAATLAGQ